MDKLRFLTGYFRRCRPLVVLASILLIAALSEVVLSQGENDRRILARQIAQELIQTGTEQYRRGYYEQAEQTLLQIQNYQEYLTSAEQERIRELLEQAHLAGLERQRILEHIQEADELIRQDQPIKARAHLMKVQDSKFLTEQERKLITEGLNKINAQLSEQRGAVAELYNRSVELYRSGQLEKAREGFLKVAGNGLLVAPEGRRAEDYLMKIDEILGQKARYSLPVGARGERLAAGQVVEEGSYIERVNQKIETIRDYTKAVVNEGIAQAQRYLNQGEFGKAKEEIEAAERVVNANRLHLGEELFKRYVTGLKQHMNDIVRKESETTKKQEEVKRVESQKAHRELTRQMEIDKKKRIAELMKYAMAYQKQQRYEEALGQLKSLLAIDPQNEQALILKETLEDMINFRRQLEIQKEKSKEKVSVLRDTEEASIPYAKEITHPKNWREIVAKRKPEEAMGEDPADMIVYEQLSRNVDLSGLSRDMAFIEAIEELKHSVEPPLKIVELWGDLEENAEVHPETAIKIDGISGIRLRMGLELLLKSVSGNFAELGYVVKEGVIIIATKESLPSELETRVYDISDLLGRPAMYYQRSGMMMGGGMGGGGMYRGDTYGGGTGGGGMYGGGMGGVYGDNLVPIYGEPLTEEEKINRANRLIKLIQDTIEPESWYDAGGDGTIKFYENNKLIVLQTPEVHQKIRALLRDMRGSSGEAGIPIALKGKPKAAVTIESRFILLPVDSNKINSFLEKEKITLPSAKADPNYQNFLNAEQTDLLLRMTQAHREAKLLTAPKVTVFDGEEAALTVARNVVYFSGYTEPNSPTDEPQPKHDSVTTGTWIQITPKIEPDNENILVKVVCEISDIAGYEKHMYKEKYPYEIPMIQKSQLSSTYLAASGQTVLLGGQKVKAEDEEGSIIEKELLVLIKAEIAETAVF